MVPKDGEARDVESVLDSSAFPIPQTPAETDLICGVDRALIEEYLYLIQKNYKRADMATFFLEQRRGVVNFQGITNVRDVLSHLVTLLDPKTPPERQAEQIHNAEEHLRRAINEPYEVALNELAVDCRDLYKQYKETVLPIKDSYPTLANAPRAQDVDAIIHRVNELTAKGRSTKSKNMWNEEWEEGVICFTEAYDSLFELHRNLEMYYNQAGQILHERQERITIQKLQDEVVALEQQIEKEGKTGRFLHLGGYALAILLAVGGVILGALIAFIFFYLAEMNKVPPTGP